MTARRATQFQTHRAFLVDLRRANGWRLPALVGIMSLIAFSDGLSVTLLLPLLARVGIMPSKSTATMLINNALGAITPTGSGVGAILVVILLLSASQMALSILQGRWSSELIYRYESGWKVRLFSALLKANWLYLTTRKGGDLTSATVVETARIGGAFYYFTLLASSTVACLIYLVIAMLVTWRTTLMLLGLVVLMILSISRLYRLSHRAGHRIGPLNAELQVLVNESLASAKIIKAAVGEQMAVDRIVKVSEALEQVSRTRMFMPSMVRGTFEFMSFAAMAIFFAYGMGPLHIAAGDIMVVLALFVRMLPKVTNSQTLIHDLNGHVPAILILQRTLEEAQANAEAQGANGDVEISLPARLQVHNLHAGYGRKQVLKGLNVTLEMPGMIGIVGGSGAGKSTLVHILLRLIKPMAGQVTLGPHDMSDVALAAWRRQIGYVPQETMFFHATVAENLALTKPDAPRAEIVAAAMMAHAHDFIMALPDGYETSVGDQGVLLSGGQRQRLGIARALLAKPALLLMDEPTSALDPKSENEILSTLDELRKSVGIVIVAHRLTTVQGADRIYVLDSGQVVESGNWSELIARQGRFHSLARLQQIVA